MEEVKADSFEGNGFEIQQKSKLISLFASAHWVSNAEQTTSSVLGKNQKAKGIQ